MAKQSSKKRKYGPKATEKVHATMRELKHGTLRSGSGRKVTSRKQAIAIGLSEARREGDKVPQAAGRSRSRTTSTRRGSRKTS